MLWKLAIVFICFFSCAAAQEPVETTHLEVLVYEDAVRMAEEQGRRLYLVFKGEGCSWCERQELEMINPKSMEAMDGLVVCVVNIQERKDLKSRYGARLVPSHRLLDSNGRIIRSASGYLDSSQLARFLSL